MLRIASILVAVTAIPSRELHAQETKPLPPPVLVDKVVATVNDSAILHSDLLTLMAAEIRGREATGKRVSTDEREAIYEIELRKRIDWHTWSQAAKTFGYVPPEQVEAWLQSELERAEQNQVRDLGGYQAFSRALQNQGRTWPTYVREQRVNKLAEFAQGYSINMRMQRQANLYVTPRMLRETYEAAKSRLFVRPANANVTVITFRGPEAKANAAKAAEIWRTESTTGRALAARFPQATATETMSASAALPEITEFALAGPVDRVSDPLEMAGTVLIAKIVDFQPARDGRFEDQDVQDELREICGRLVRMEFTAQALDRARQRTQVWRAGTRD